MAEHARATNGTDGQWRPFINSKWLQEILMAASVAIGSKRDPVYYGSVWRCKQGVNQYRVCHGLHQPNHVNISYSQVKDIEQ